MLVVRSVSQILAQYESKELEDPVLDYYQDQINYFNDLLVAADFPVAKPQNGPYHTEDEGRHSDSGKSI
ncbi:MAG: hypothetical protein JXQ97_12000 [Natronospirillum sp.]